MKHQVKVEPRNWVKVVDENGNAVRNEMVMLF
jgi:uncharacterized protein YnzC (UPF0291/DUF896 family)